MEGGDDEIIRVFQPEDEVPPYQMLAAIASNKLEWTVEMNMKSRSYPFLKTSIMATIGPSCSDVPTIEKMIEAGMRIARLNFCHSNHESHLETLTKVREASRSYSAKMRYYVPIAVAAELKGPTVRTGEIEGEGTVELVPGGILKLTTDKAFAEHGNEQQIYVDYENIQKTVKVGNRILIDNGLIRLLVTNIQGNVLTTTVEAANTLGSGKLVNLPGVQVDLPDITDRDVGDFQFIKENDVDIVMISFVRSGEAIRQARKLLGPQKKNVLIFAKIQNQQGVDNLQDILNEADGIVVVRKVLSIEMPQEKMLQTMKYLLIKCNFVGKPCIISSQFLGSMKTANAPTSAETNDLAQAINDGAQGILLSSITAEGEQPVQCVEIAAKICKHGEAAIWQRNMFDELLLQFQQTDDFFATAIAAARLAFLVSAAAILVTTTSGKTAFAIAQFQPRCLVVAITTSESVARESMVHKGVLPLLYQKDRKSTWRRDIEARIQFALLHCKVQGLVMTGDPVVAVTPTKQGYPNTVRLIYSSVIPEKVYS